MITPEQAQQLHVDHDSAHGFDHVLRVWRLAMHIACEEGADLAVVNDAALLHDVGRAQQAASGGDHAAISAEAAALLLAEAPASHREAVCQAIREHRFRSDQRPSTLASQVLFDADKLDAIGAIGVARAYAIAGAWHQHLWADVSSEFAARTPGAGVDDLDNDEHTPVHEFEFKLRRLADLVVTDTARRMAAERHAFMSAFFARLAREVAGEL
ncbi:MAG: HD domain-containing protein [Anaerolineales bacterium]